MGLKLTTDFKGTSIVDAYYKVNEVVTKKEGADFNARFNVGMSTDENSECIALQDKVEYVFPYDLESSDNIIAQTYTFMKTLDEFTGAVDA